MSWTRIGAGIYTKKDDGTFADVSKVFTSRANNWSWVVWHKNGQTYRGFSLTCSGAKNAATAAILYGRRVSAE